MFNEFMVVLLIGHLLGDFYFQTNQIANGKETSLPSLCLHCLYYWIAMLLTCVPVFSWKIILGATVASGIHLFIDITKYVYVSSTREKATLDEANGTVYLLDQFAHLSCLGILAFWAVKSGTEIHTLNSIEEFFTIIGVPKFLFATWFLSFLTIGKPANITIQKLMQAYKPTRTDSQEKSDKKAGRFIGTVERSTMLILLAVGQYSAIGLVLTAKSIARYDKIAHESEFAEYYLLGTLLSTLLVILASFILRWSGN